MGHFRRLLTYDEEELAALDMNFEWTVAVHEDVATGAGAGETVPITVELGKGGSMRCVTTKNKNEFVQRFVDWYIRESIQSGLRTFARGFLRVVDGHSLSLFESEQLEMLIAGEPHREGLIDFREAIMRAKYDGGYSAASPVV